MKTRLSESQAVAEELSNQKAWECACDWLNLSFHCCFRLQQSGFHLIVNDGVVSRVKRKWKSFDSSDSNSVALDSAYDSIF